MVSVTLKTNSARKSTVVDVTSTPSSVFESFDIPMGNATISVNGRILYNDEPYETFETLGVADGTVVTLSAIVKGDGAAE